MDPQMRWWSIYTGGLLLRWKHKWTSIGWRTEEVPCRQTHTVDSWSYINTLPHNFLPTYRNGNRLFCRHHHQHHHHHHHRDQKHRRPQQPPGSFNQLQRLPSLHVPLLSRWWSRCGLLYCPIYFNELPAYLPVCRLVLIEFGAHSCALQCNRG